MGMGMGSKFGKDSDEYEMAGGSRKSERKPQLGATATKLHKAKAPASWQGLLLLVL
jgi:hypothetical protein